MTLSSLAPSSDYHVTVVAVDSLGAISPLTAPLTVHTADPTPTHGNVQAFMLATTDQSFADLQAHYQQIGVLYPTYFECNSDGVGDRRRRPAGHRLGAGAADQGDAALQLPEPDDREPDPDRSDDAREHDQRPRWR